MATQALTKPTAIPMAATIERVLIGGDLAELQPDQRVSYYRAVCDSVGLNPLTKPFEYIRLNGKLVLYAKRDATDQLRKIHGVSIDSVTSQRIEDVFVVTASAKDRDGRTDSSTGAVCINGLKGDALANALMKAETKAKRRVTLSICGLGMLDETEIETVRDAVEHRAEPQPISEPARTVNISGRVEKTNQSMKGVWFNLTGGISLFVPKSIDCTSLLDKEEIEADALEKMDRNKRTYYEAVAVRPFAPVLDAEEVQTKDEELPF